MVDMKNYARDISPIKWMQALIDTLANAEMWHDKTSRNTHMMGFQGAKRYNRIRSHEDRCLRLKIQHYMIDVFGIDLEPNWKSKNIEFSSYKDYLEQYLDTEIEAYTDLNKIHNALVSEGYVAEACLVKDYLPTVVKEIEKVRRWILEGDNSQWMYHHVRIVDMHIHDKCKEHSSESAYE